MVPDPTTFGGFEAHFPCLLKIWMDGARIENLLGILNVECLFTSVPKMSPGPVLEPPTFPPRNRMILMEAFRSNRIAGGLLTPHAHPEF